MKIHITLLLTLIAFNTISSQNIGDSAQLLLPLIEQNYNNKKTKDILKYGELQYTYEVKRDSLIKIQEIIVNQKNIIYHDLEAKSDVKTHYFFNQMEELSSVKTTYINLSEKYIKTKFNKSYGHRHHGYGYYFTNDYQNVRYIYSEDDKAVVIFQKFVPTVYESLKFHKLIEKKQKEYKKKLE